MLFGKVVLLHHKDLDSQVIRLGYSSQKLTEEIPRQVPLSSDSRIYGTVFPLFGNHRAGDGRWPDYSGHQQYLDVLLQVKPDQFRRPADETTRLF